MKSIAKVLKYEGLLLTGIALLVLFLATDMFVRFWFILLLGPVLLVAGFLMDLGSIGTTLRKRTTKYGVNAILFTVVVGAIIGFANVIAGGYEKSWDGTFAKVNTLSDQTVKILSELKSPVQVTAFFAAGEGRDVEEVLKRYRNAAPKEIFSYRLVDPDQHPEVLKSYDVSRRGAIVVESGGRKNIIADPGESALTQSILKVTQAKVGPICFVTGHGEATVGDDEESGASMLKRLLENENHDVKEIILAGRGVPEDCASVVIAGADRPLSDVEVQTVKGWVQNGGSLLFMAEPLAATGLETWLSGLGVVFDENVVVEPVFNPFFGSQLGITPVVKDYPPHEITREMDQPTAFSLARSLTLDYAVETAYVTPILKTTAEAWGETDVQNLLENQSVEKAEGDKDGPLVLGAAIEIKGPAAKEPEAVDEPPEAAGPKPLTSARVVVIGDSSFVRNGMITQLFNTDLVLNTIAWLTGRQEVISVRPNQFPSSAIFLTGDDRAKVFFIAVIALPMLVSMFGIGMMISRGRRSQS